MATYYSDDTEKEPIDKAGAETIFGMDHDYTKEELDNAYHSAVEDAVAAGDQGRLEDLTAARDVLTEGFNAGAAVMTSDIKSEYSGGALPPVSWGDIWEGFDRINDAQEWWNSKMEPINLPYAYNSAHYKACQKTGIPTNTDYPAPKRKNTPPMWYRGVYKVVSAPIWRIAFIVLAIWWGITFIQANPEANIMDDAFSILFAWVGVLVVILLNTIFGWATNLVRWVIMVISNKVVQMQLDGEELSAARTYVAKNGNATGLATRK